MTVQYIIRYSIKLLLSNFVINVHFYDSLQRKSLCIVKVISRCVEEKDFVKQISIVIGYVINIIPFLRLVL